MDARHIALGTLDQRKEIAIKDNIWWQEALNIVSFQINLMFIKLVIGIELEKEYLSLRVR